ncbi:kinase-like protein [Lentinus tigrinus ALCF2SS1-7]|uniref:Kinase-like protein n=1 Tax=Lentinus tigrinus ALCF2SS1-6 TaxID=1328759 RepID=A0A5C2SET9_9APHY|nr:kinase-like protein [Lentinus tigrinus ALCF2SS1-6]RPD75952.1 kinase-like protein [Lentinus tigrinus ALCF2SS1-7]
MTDGYIQSFTVAGFIQTTHYIGTGGTGAYVWKAFNILTGSQLALKTKPIPASTGDPPAGLVHEAGIYQLLRGAREGFPTIHWSGVDGNRFVLAMDLLGPNLQSLQRLCRGSFSVRTICMLAEQMITRLQFVHSRGIISGDIKPQNYAMGIGNKCRIVHLLDFGHAAFFINPATNEHIPFHTERLASGTVRYACMAAHLGHELSRRDDLESLLYSLVELYHGQLPWATEQELLRVVQMKAGKEFEELLSESLPEFRAYHAHCASLSFGQAPDYTLLKNLFRERMRMEGWHHDGAFDWENATALERGTLVPEEYVFDLRYVERLGLDPQ